jgi:hypothetical protein
MIHHHSSSLFGHGAILDPFLEGLLMRASKLLFVALLAGSSALTLYACVGDEPVVPVVDSGVPDTSMPDDGSVADTSPVPDSSCGKDAAGKQLGYAAFPFDGIAHSMVFTGDGHIFGGLFSGTTPSGLVSKGQQDAVVMKLATNGTLVWADSFGGTLNDDINKLAIDGAGDIYLTGFSFSPSMSFGTTVLTNTGNGDFGFLAKLSGVDGSVIWAEAIAPASPGYSVCGALDANGNHLILGCHFNTAQITYPLTDGGTASMLTYGGGNLVVASIDPATGGWLTTTHMGAANADAGSSLVTVGQLEATSNGGFVFAGTFDGPVLKDGTGSKPSINLTRVGTASNGFVGLFDAKGNAVWANDIAPAGDGGVIQTTHAALNGTGGALAVVSFTGGVDLGSGPTFAAGGGGRDMAIASYPAAGPPTWSKVFGTPLDDFIYPATTDTCGNPAVTLSVKGGITLDGVALPVPQQNAQAPVLMKLDPMGKVLWAHGPTPPASSSAYMLFVSRAGNGFLGVGGDYTGSVDIAGTGGTVTQSGGSTNPFLQFWGP